MISLRRSKPTSYEAAKSLVLIEEEITAKTVIDRMVTLGRKEIPTNRSLAAKFKMIPILLWFALMVHKVRQFSAESSDWEHLTQPKHQAQGLKHQS